MIPFDDIKEGDVFRDPIFGSKGLLYLVEQKNDKEKMIYLRAYKNETMEPVPGLKGFWKKNTDRIFSDFWKV